MKKLILVGAFILGANGTLLAKDQVTELVKGAVPSTHVSVMCISGVKVAIAAFCDKGCGLVMTQLNGSNGKPMSCK